jgi:hypothetical protein
MEKVKLMLNKVLMLILISILVLLPIPQLCAQDAENVELVGYLPGGILYDVHVVGNYAYVAAIGMFFIIDISNPISPIQVGYYDALGWAEDVYVKDNYAYIANREKGLKIIDVSNPALPTEAGYYDTSGKAYSIYVKDNYAYVADGDEGLRIIDVSNPIEPVEVGHYEIQGRAYGVYVKDNCAYVVTWGTGLWILRYTGYRPQVNITLTANLNIEVPLIAGYTFTGSEPIGDYEIGGRLLNYITGEYITADIESFNFTL